MIIFLKCSLITRWTYNIFIKESEGSLFFLIKKKSKIFVYKKKILSHDSHVLLFYQYFTNVNKNTGWSTLNVTYL